MEKANIEWYGITFLEPVVFLTNWMITIQCFYYFQKFQKLEIKSAFLFYWKYFFFLFGASTFFGGLSHLLYHYFELWGKIPGWSLAILSITALELAVFHDDAERYKHGIRFVWVQTLVLFILLVLDFNFNWVTVQTVIGLVLVLGVYSILQVRKKGESWRGFLYGIGWMLLSVPVVILKVDLSIWFNRHDISHLLMMLCLHQFYKASLKVSESHSK